MSVEKLKTNKIPQLHFKPEGYKSAHDGDYLDELLEVLKEHGYAPDNLVFSGFNGAPILRGEPIGRHPTIFGMNAAAWRATTESPEATPAEYAQGYIVPCIGLYDKSQLAEAYSYDLDIYDPDDRMDLANIVLGRYLADLESDVAVEEALVHRNYPTESPADALVGLVFLKD